MTVEISLIASNPDCETERKTLTPKPNRSKSTLKKFLTRCNSTLELLITSNYSCVGFAVSENHATENGVSLLNCKKMVSGIITFYLLPSSPILINALWIKISPPAETAELIFRNFDLMVAWNLAVPVIRPLANIWLNI